MNSELPSAPEHIVENIIGIHSSQKIYSKDDAIMFDSNRWLRRSLLHMHKDMIA